jgi:hypothetical protein
MGSTERWVYDGRAVSLLLFAAINLIALIAQSNPLAPPSRRRSVWSWLDAYRFVGAPFVRAHSIAVACAFIVLALMSAGAAVLFAIPGYVGAPFVLVEMNRSEVLSRIAGIKPGRISLDRTFFRMVLLHVGVPLLGLAATRFTTVGALFGDILKPLMQLFGGIGAD